MDYLIKEEQDICTEETKFEVLKLLPKPCDFYKNLSDSRFDLDLNQIRSIVEEYKKIVDLLVDYE